MSMIEKLYQKIKNNPKNVRFEEIERLLLNIGFEERQAQKGSSHYIFYHKKLKNNIVIPKPHQAKHVKPIYIKKALIGIEILERMN
ncbi:MAG: type II toxin-antitoxin system HicA family toxin [bacterium]|nr:type II toxin-antitoxin system HicA family toxin [bacterium]